MRLDYVIGGLVLLGYAFWTLGPRQGVLIGVPLALFFCFLQWIRTDLRRATFRWVSQLGSRRRQDKVFRSLFEVLGVLCCDPRSGRLEAINGLSRIGPALRLDAAQVDMAKEAFDVGREGAPQMDRPVRILKRMGRGNSALIATALYAWIEMLDTLKPSAATDESRLGELAETLGLGHEAVSRERAIQALRPLDETDPPLFDEPEFELVGERAARALNVDVDADAAVMERAFVHAPKGAGPAALGRAGWPEALVPLAEERDAQLLKARILLISYRAWVDAVSSVRSEH